MDKDLEELSKALIEETKRYEELAKALMEKDQALFDEWQASKKKCEDLEKATKGLLKLSDKTVEVENYTFKVSTSTRTSLDLEKVVVKAEEYEHIEVLLQHGVLAFKGDASMIDRLPEKLRPIYKRCVSTTKVKRVTMPKALCRKW